MAFFTYPKLVYHPDGREQPVLNAEQEAAYVAAGWSVTPPGLARGVSSIPADTLENFVTLTGANAKLRSMKIINDTEEDGNVMRFCYGDNVSRRNYTFYLEPGERWTMPMIRNSFGFDEPEYRGLITAYWVTAQGYAQVTVTEFP